MSGRRRAGRERVKRRGEAVSDHAEPSPNTGVAILIALLLAGLVATIATGDPLRAPSDQQTHRPPHRPGWTARSVRRS